MTLVEYHKTEAYMLFNPINGKILVTRDIIIDENSAWNWDSNDATNKPLMSYDFDKKN